MNPPTEANGEWTLKKVDSLVESVYNSEKNLEWLREVEAETIKGRKAPPASVISDSDYNINDSRDRLREDESEWQLLGPSTAVNQGSIEQPSTTDNLGQGSIEASVAINSSIMEGFSIGESSKPGKQ